MQMVPLLATLKPTVIKKLKIPTTKLTRTKTAAKKRRKRTLLLGTMIKKPQLLRARMRMARKVRMLTVRRSKRSMLTGKLKAGTATT